MVLMIPRPIQVSLWLLIISKFFHPSLRKVGDFTGFVKSLGRC